MKSSLIILALVCITTAVYAYERTEVAFPTLTKISKNSLAPIISEETMMTHHDKHFRGYTNKFNAAIIDLFEHDPKSASQSAEDIVKHYTLLHVPESLKQRLRNNGGGYLNHKMVNLRSTVVHSAHISPPFGVNTVL
eukprot:TRINITY_DN17777_c0_g1_i1.p1 TRINITY_DN17777_c0_g1~~TRINITY_DN17777_c0_g1_i1.p1  ORF type:complete len:137 (-),score=33.36 TRINITY_DN17777_c0_g1_i1:22-432(-)